MSKKITTTLLVLFAAICFSSCVKTYDCDCTIDDGHGYTASQSYPIVGTKKIAQQDCDDTKESMELTYNGTANCTLK